MPEIGVYGQDDRVNSLINYSRAKPRLYWTDDYNSSLKKAIDLNNNNYLVNHKDSREKIGINVQFEICSDSNNIIIGHKFIEYQQMIATKRPDSIRLVGSYSLDDLYSYGDEKGKGTYTDTATTSYSVSDDGKLTIYLSQTSMLFFASCALVDENNNLLIGINNPSITTVIYMNIFKTRDRNKYNDSSLTTWTK